MVGRALRRALAIGAATMGLEIVYAVLRPSPHQDEYDPSGKFGDPTKPTLRVAVMGDSSVTGPGVSAADEIWISVLCRRLAATHRVLMRSFAVGGSKASDLIADQLGPVIDYAADIVFVAVGANDVIKGVPLRRFERNLDSLTRRLMETVPVVVLSGVGDLGSIPRLHPPLSNLMSRRSSRFDEAHWRVAERHGATVIHQRSDDREPWYNDRRLWSADLFHVSSAGHERWANTAWRTVGPLVEGLHGSG